MTPGFIDGPYIAPTIGLGLRQTFGGSCDTCVESFWEIGSELGWDMFGEKLFEPFKAIVGRGTVWEVCEPNEPFCEEESGGPVIVSPRDGQLLDCSHYPRLVFRAPGAATTEDPASPHQFDIEFKWENAETGEHSSKVNTSVRHGAPEWFIECVPTGEGDWGECSFTPADNPCLFGGPKNSNHSWSVTAHVPPASGSATAEAEFAVP